MKSLKRLLRLLLEKVFYLIKQTLKLTNSNAHLLNIIHFFHEKSSSSLR